MFNGTCCGVDLQGKPAYERYYSICWTSVWGGNGIKSIFDTIDELKPGDTIDYTTWQKLMYANKKLAEAYHIFDNERLREKRIYSQWNDKTEDFDYYTWDESMKRVPYTPKWKK